MRQSIVLVFIAVLGVAMIAARAESKEFYDRFDAVPVENRLPYLCEYVCSAGIDVAAKRIAFDEMAATANAQQSFAEAIRTCESLLDENAQGSEMHQAAYLTKARLSYANGDRESAEAAFVKAIEYNWRLFPDRPANWMYIECLNEGGEYWKAALLEYECIVRPRAWMIEDGADFLCFLRWAIYEKVRNSENNKLMEVWKSLSTEKSGIERSIAEAFITAVDGDFDESISAFREIERRCGEGGADENSKFAKEIPVYMCAIRYITGNGLEDAKGEMYRYLEFNRNDLERAIKCVCSIGYTMQNLGPFVLPRMTDLTTPLVENEFVVQEGTISEELRANARNLHLTALMMARKTDKAMAMADELVRECFPKYGVGADAAVVKAYLLRLEGKFDEAEVLLKEVLVKSENHAVQRGALSELVMVCDARGDDPKEFILPTLKLLEETAPPHDKLRYSAMAKKYE